MRDVQYKHYYSYDEMVEFLLGAQKDYQPFIRLDTLTETLQGRKVYLATITDFSTGAPESKSAYCIQANVHAPEGAGTTAALHVIHSLLTKAENRELLKEITFYVIPRVNPDGTEYALTARAEIRSRMEAADRKNGLTPMDLNGDGLILSMRWEDPAGPMKEDETDPRLMVRREPGDKKGPFYHVAEEGIIPGYDGTDIAAGMRHVDFNRNWPVNWWPNSNASLYPFAEQEMKALGDFLVRHPNIFAGVDLHCGNNAILRPAMRPDSEMNHEDLKLILNIGRQAERITGFSLIHEREYREPWRPPIMLNGNSNDFMYFKMGISHYVVELGNGFNGAGISTSEYLAADERTRETVFMRKVLSYHDMHGSSLFVPWEEYTHPQLGRVEIGGLMKGCGYYMYPPVMEEIAPKTTEFMLRHAKMRPELVISRVDAVQAGEDIYRIRATIGNIGGLDTCVMKSGGSEDIRRPVRVRLVLPDDVELLSRGGLMEFENLGALGETVNMEWFIKAPRGAEVMGIIEASHPRAGICRVELNMLGK